MAKNSLTSKVGRHRKTLVIIGGREEKTGKMEILTEVAKTIRNGRLCIATVASSMGDELWEEYRKLFRFLGVRKITHLDVIHRSHKVDQVALRAVKDADAVFFTGGDQLKITSELGGTVVAERINEIYQKGGLIAGTSAGAAVILKDKAAVFVDGRYTVQVREQVDPKLFEIRDLVEGGVPAYLREAARPGW